MTISNGAPDVVIEVSKETAEFIIENCDNTIAYALSILDKVTPNSVVALVEKIEQFKRVREAVKKGMQS